MKKRIAICCAVMILTAAVFSGCSQATDEPETTTAAANIVESESVETMEVVEATEAAPEGKTIDTTFFSFDVSGDCAQYFTHQTVMDGDSCMEIFTMVKDGEEKELFRVYFNDDSGNNLGVLTVDGEKIPVALEVPEYSEDSFPDEESRDIYYELMENLNNVVGTIQQDDRFGSDEKVVVKTEEKQISYWKFTLPAGMELEEMNTEDGYLATFYGNINAERYKLYTVSVGDNPLRTVLGTYPVDGVSKIVSVESEELPDTNGWQEGNVLELYKMMESINDVIQTIMESEGFSEQTVETP